MKELEFLEKINELDPALLEDRPAPVRRVGSRLIRRIAIAAAAVLLLGGTVYGVVRGIELRKISPSKDEDGVEAKAELPLVKWSSFEGEIKNVGEAIVQQYRDYVPEPMWSSYLGDPGSNTRSFQSISAAMKYIGLPGLKEPSFPFAEYKCSVTAHGDEEGRVDFVKLYAEHIEWNDLSAQEAVTVLTEYAKKSEYVSGGVWTWEFPRDVEFASYTTPGGNECRIVELRPEYDNDYMGLTGYATVGSAFYELNLGAVPMEKYEQALEILHQWADALD
ncbi:MAG: hypothetical protein IKH07_03465 [Oscillospiraceae bacterium]|nr:hypothetical protein [Oscillospiraceae bacterium]